MTKLEKIEWLDHATFSDNAWHSIEDLVNMQPVTCYTVGWVIHETKKHLVVVSTLNDSEVGTGEFVILKGTVVKRTVLEE